MMFNNFLQRWSKLMARKKIKAGNKNAKDPLRVQMFRTAYNEEEATQTKISAQKILSVMFAALYKRGRPKKEKEEIIYGL